MHNGEDTDMPLPWDDTDFWIEDRGRRGAHLLRGPAGSAGYWTAPHGGWTYVLPIGAPLNTPPPPRRGVAAQAQRPDSPPVQTGTGAALTVQTPTATNSRGNTGRSSTDTQSTDGSVDASRHWESPAFRADTARHQRFLNDQRFRDEPHWDPRSRPRDSRTAPRDYPEDRTRYNERVGYSSDREDNMRARDLRAIRARPYSREARRDDHRADDTRKDGARKDERRTEGDNPARLFDSPDPHVAPRAPDGHPLAPRAASREHVDELLPDPDYVAREDERLARSRAKSSQNRARGIVPPARPTDERTGIWRTLQVGTIAQAINLCEWLDLGEETAYQKFQHVVQTCAAAPTEFRAEGEAYLLRHQQQLEQSWWRTTRGEARAPARAAPPVASGSRNNTAPASTPRTVVDVDAVMDDAAPEQRSNAAKKKGKTVAQVIASQWSFGTVLPVQPARETAAVYVDGPGYFGTSPPDPTDIAPPPAAVGDFRVWQGLPNSQATVLEVIRHYEFAPPHLWTQGMRNQRGEVPRQSGDSPRTGDALAYQTFVALGPADRRNYAHQWRRFFDTAITMMSIPGLYHHLVTHGGYPPASDPMAHFQGLTDNITMPYIAAWFVRHGVPTTGPIVEQMEAFARSRRNARANIPDLNQVGWEDEPRSVASAMAADTASIPPWSVVSHVAPPRPSGPSRPNAVTAPTQVTTQGLSSSMHAPMEVEAPEFSIQTGTSGVLIINDPVGPTLPPPPPETPESDDDDAAHDAVHDDDDDDVENEAEAGPAASSG
ncbi:hypothetical protein C8R47DRAFT_1075420 [Mycena vitilis]|nr:hypothetical protein C8R47DRAFT_1075420 [Mycena vitilis]